jgi:hypothetical protein
MRNDELEELEMWRKQWQGQPAVVVDLIRRVERGTFEMRLGRLALWAPFSVSAITTILVALSPSVGRVLFVSALWLVGGLVGWFVRWNQRDVWTPDAETTTAYLELSIKRCQRTLRDLRVGRWVAVLIPAFVLFGVYSFLNNLGVLDTALGFWITVATFLWTIGVVGFATWVGVHRGAQRAREELEYLLDLQRQLRLRQEDGNIN